MRSPENTLLQDGNDAASQFPRAGSLMHNFANDRPLEGGTGRRDGAGWLVRGSVTPGVREWQETGRAGVENSCLRWSRVAKGWNKEEKK